MKRTSPSALGQPDSQTRGTFDQIIEGCDPSIVAIASALKARITAMHRDRVEIV